MLFTERNDEQAKNIYGNTKHTAVSCHYLHTVIKYGGVSGHSHI